ncbi:hypothetical protein AMELA_G00027910 [Ameiurus melas]|uniref:Uncharacterized protein n=1 Tax=Ameiurus melas TaxID=219545 RepID=A0A7J6BD16_AMEME|nr:hypothetical protein AMELA_G00027910 [Ameiurus melas]
MVPPTVTHNAPVTRLLLGDRTWTRSALSIRTYSLSCSQATDRQRKGSILLLCYHLFTGSIQGSSIQD